MTRTTQTAPTFPSSGVIAAGASASLTFDATACVFAGLLIKNACGSVSTTAGLQITIQPGVGATPDYATLGYSGGTIPAVASTTSSNEISLSPGPYKITATNLDASNSVTATAELDFYT